MPTKNFTNDHQSKCFEFDDEDIGYLLMAIEDMKTRDGKRDRRFLSHYFDFPNKDYENDNLTLYTYSNIPIPFFHIVYKVNPEYVFQLSNQHTFRPNGQGLTYIGVRLNPAPTGYKEVLNVGTFASVLDHFKIWLKEIQLKSDLRESNENFLAGKVLDESGTINCDSDEPMRPIEKDALIERLDIIINLMRNQEGLSLEEKEIGIDTVNEIKASAKSDIAKKDLIDTIPSKFIRIIKRQAERAGDKISDEGIKIVWRLLKGGLLTILASPSMQAQLGPVAPFLAALIVTSENKQIE